MALEPNIILQAGNFKTPDYGETMERRALIEGRNAQNARLARTDQMAQAKTVRLGEVGTLAASGDFAGAKAKAAAAGDFDVLDHIKGLEADHRAELARRVEVAAPLAFEAGKLPYEQRKAFITAQTPRLVANGWKPEEIAGLDPTDQALGSIVASAQSIGDMLKRQDQQAEFADKRADRASDREFSRGNAYISAGILPPGAGGAGGAPGAATGATAGRTQYGWTPRARNGGDNTDAAVDGKIAGMAKALGVDPDAQLTNMTPLQIAGALTLSEGGPGSIADRRNNPGNLTDPKTGDYRRFPTKAAGLQAAAAQVKRNLARGQTTIRTMVEGLPVDGAPAGGGSGLPGGLQVIPGGKLDKPKPARMTAEEVKAEGLDPSVVYYRDAAGVPQAVGGQAKGTAGGNLKPPPVAATKAYIDNRTSIRKLREAWTAVDKNPDAVGFWKGITPNAITSRTDPTGVDARGKVADIGSLLIHDRSGAAVTVAETPRLLPFVPQVGDDAKTAKTKLHNLRLALEAENSDIADAYSADQGYKFPQFRDGTLTPRPRTTAPARGAPAAGGPKVGAVENGYRFKGGNPASQSSWEKVK